MITLPSKHLWAVGLMAASAGSMLCGYEFIRSPSNTLYMAAYGAENIVVVRALMPLGILSAIYIYGRLLSALGPRRTLWATSLASGGLILACFGAIQAGFKVATGVLYILREVYVVLLMAQYWSFVNSTLGQESARRLNGPFVGLASLGAILGGMGVSRLAEPLGTPSLLLFAAGSIVPAVLFSDWAYAKCGEPAPAGKEETERVGTIGIGGLRAYPVLYFLFWVVVTTQVISTILEVYFQVSLQAAIPDVDRQTAFSGRLFARVNMVAAFLQFAAAPILLRRVPLDAIYIGLPLIHVASSLFLILAPSLTMAATAYLLFKSLDYSIFATAKEILYIPLSFDARYRTKEVIDVMGYRLSKGGVAFILTITQKAGIFPAFAYPWVALSGALAWLALVPPLVRCRRKSENFGEGLSEQRLN